jgi:hypothetical protein
MGDRAMRRLSIPRISTLLWIAVAGLLVGFCVGRVSLGDSATAATSVDSAGAAATATREAELAELMNLRTQVAQTPPTVVCSPVVSPTPMLPPSPTPTATPVSPSAMNEPLPHAGEWTLTITGVTKAATVTGYNQSRTAKGIYVVVNLTVTNNGRDRRNFPFEDFILVDARGRVFELAFAESIMVSGDASSGFPPSVPTDTAIVYDVTTDVGNSFVLESRTDPVFRVQVEITLRG